MKRWLVGAWLVLVLGGWALTESIDDRIEPSSGTEPTPAPPTSTGHPSDFACPARPEPDRPDGPHGTVIACAYKVED